MPVLDFPAPAEPSAAVTSRTGTGEAVSSSPLRLRTILVPTDFSSASTQALEYAKRLALPFGASLRVLNVVEPMDPPHGALLAHLLLESSATVKAHARQEMAIFADVIFSHEAPPCQFDFRVGSAHEEIVRAAREMACDLIVLAAHGHSRLSRWLIGSTAEKVVRLAPCPVLVVREPGTHPDEA